MITSAEEFLRLRTSQEQRDYSRAATEDVASPGVWWDIISLYPEMRVWVVHNKNVPVNVLRELADSDQEPVRIAVAQKRKCPVDVLLRLAFDDSEGVRHTVATNAKTPTHILELLLNDPWQTIRDIARGRLRPDAPQD